MFSLKNKHALLERDSQKERVTSIKKRQSTLIEQDIRRENWNMSNNWEIGREERQEKTKSVDDFFQDGILCSAPGLIRAV